MTEPSTPQPKRAATPTTGGHGGLAQHQKKQQACGLTPRQQVAQARRVQVSAKQQKRRLEGQEAAAKREVEAGLQHRARNQANQAKTNQSRRFHDGDTALAKGGRSEQAKEAKKNKLERGRRNMTQAKAARAVLAKKDLDSRRHVSTTTQTTSKTVTATEHTVETYGAAADARALPSFGDVPSLDEPLPPPATAAMLEHTAAPIIS